MEDLIDTSPNGMLALRLGSSFASAIGLLAIGLTIVIGLAGALLVTRALAGLLVGVSATDVSVFGAVVIGLVVVTLGSSFVPARRASRIDPWTAIRSDG